MSPKEITDALTQKFSQNPLILGFVLVGSQARETGYTATEYSDLEAYIVVNDEHVLHVEKELPEVVRSLGAVLFSYKNRWAGFSTVFTDLFRLELPIAKMSELESVFSRPKAQTVKTLLDKTDGKLATVLAKRPETINFEKLFEDTTADFWYMLIVGKQYYEKGEIWNARSVLQILQSSLITLFELANKRELLLLESNKRVEDFLTPEQLRKLKEVSPGYNKEEIKNALVRIADVFSEMSKLIKDSYHYGYDERIEDMVKGKLFTTDSS